MRLKSIQTKTKAKSKPENKSNAKTKTESETEIAATAMTTVTAIMLIFVFRHCAGIIMRLFWDRSGFVSRIDQEGSEFVLPFTIFVILLMVAFGRSLWLIFVAIGAVEWLSMARIVRAGVIGMKKQELVEAAVSLGYSHTRIIVKHLIPNVLGPVIVIATLTVPAVMLLEAFLSFLGLGVQPPNASWGVLINEGQQNMDIFPWLLMFPAFFFALTLFALNFLGDGLRDALDPKSSKD